MTTDQWATIIGVSTVTFLSGLLGIAFAGHYPPITTLAAAPWRAARWAIAGWHTRRAAHRAWAAGADIFVGIAQLTGELPIVKRPYHDVPPRRSNDRCKDTGSAHCRECRLGGDCRDTDPAQRPAYAAGMTLPRPGRHTLAVRLAAYRRRLRLSYLAQAVQLDPTWYAGKLGRPVQLGLGRAIGGAV